MKTLSMNDRVIVIQTEGITINAPGTVTRVRRDGSAWIELDARSTQGGVHPFAADDSNRARNVLAHPEHCEPARKNHKERRDAKKHDRVSAQPEPTIEMFGRDHWSMFAYIETRVVDHKGEPERAKMRCDAGRHPLLAAAHHCVNGKKYPTRLNGDALLDDHDDWDCVDDLIRVGLLENIGTSMHPAYRLTDEGWHVAGTLRAHRAGGGSSSNFCAPERKAS